MTFSPSKQMSHTIDLKNVMKELINFCFKGGEKQVIAVTEIKNLVEHGLKIKSKYKINFD